MWAGSEYEYQNHKCTFTGVYNETEKPEERVDTALSWFKHPKTPANLVMLYVEQPDLFGHAYGYESSIVSFIDFFFIRIFDKSGTHFMAILL